MSRVCVADRMARALLGAVAGFEGEATAETLSCESWSSITFCGARLRLSLRIEGEGAEAAADGFLAGMTERDYRVPGHLLVDLALVSDERDAGGTRVALTLEAVTVEAA